ncbi:MAG: POTRA domain-containing protein, partial [Buchnera aphidicola]|nr:POTRA domain-containing protein [Buchnera aphidicola]
NIHKNDLYNKEKIDSIIYNIRELLASDGYINASIIMSPEVNHVNKTMVLNFNIDLKKRYSVHKIYFKGNKFTKDIVLRREIK